MDFKINQYSMFLTLLIDKKYFLYLKIENQFIFKQVKI
jgi:hypothetical protein